MNALSRDRRLSTAALLGAFAIGPAAILHFFGKHEVQIAGGVHFFGIGVSAGFAWLAAVILTLCGRPASRTAARCSSAPPSP